MEGLIIPPHKLQTKMGCMVGEWLGWIHVHPNHLPVSSAHNICTTKMLLIHLGSFLPEGRAPIAIIFSWFSRGGGCGVVRAVKAYKLTQEG